MDDNNKEDIKEEIIDVEVGGETDENGIKIADDVIAIIAGKAASDISGVYSMSGGFAGGISEVFGKKSYAKGIKVDNSEKDLKIDVNIIVEYGARIPDVAYEIQNRVKKAVESMTGINVAEVNVHVQGVNTDTSNKEEINEKLN